MAALKLGSKRELRLEGFSNARKKRVTKHAPMPRPRARFGKRSQRCSVTSMARRLSIGVGA